MMDMLSNLTSIDWIQYVGWTVAVILMGVGIVGTVIPALPGIPMIFAGAWIAAWLGDYELIGWGSLTALAILTVIGFAVDWFAQTMGAQRAGASRYGIAGATVGTVAGLFMGIFGIFVMPLIGAFLGELVAQRGIKTAGAVGIATWLGMIAGIAVKLALSFAMLGIVIFRLW